MHKHIGPAQAKPGQAGEGGGGVLALASEASEEYLGGVSAGRGSSLSADRN